MRDTEIKPITFRQASDFINRFHRHHKATVGHKFSVGLYEGELVAELNISYGVALSEEVCSIDEQIILADQRMYFAKKAYYQRIGKDRRNY